MKFGANSARAIWATRGSTWAGWANYLRNLKAAVTLIDPGRSCGRAGRLCDAAAFALSDPKSPPPLPPGTSVVDLAVWTIVIRALLNLDETVTKE